MVRIFDTYSCNMQLLFLKKSKLKHLQGKPAGLTFSATTNSVTGRYLNRISLEVTITNCINNKLITCIIAPSHTLNQQNNL